MKKFFILGVALCLLSCQLDRDRGIVLLTAERMMLDHPEGALKLLNSIDSLHWNNKESHAKYALLYSQALDKNYIDRTSDSLIRIAVNYYEKRGSYNEIALSYYYLGRIYVNAKTPEQAIEAFVRSENAALKTDNYYLLGLINCCIGNMHKEQYSLQEALSRYNRSVNYYHNALSKRNEAQVMVYIADTYYLMDKCDSSLLRYNNAINLYNAINSCDESISLYELIATIRLNKNDDITEIKQDLRSIYSVSNNGKIPIRSLGLWLSIYIKENQLDSARLCGATILDNKHIFSASQIAGCLVLMEQIESKANNFRRAYNYSQSANNIIDSINRTDRETMIQSIEQKYKANLYKQSLTYFESRYKYQKVILILTLALLGILAILGYILFIRWRKKTTDELCCARAEVERLSATYSELQDQFKNLTLKMDPNNEQEMRLFKALEERLIGLRSLLSEANLSKPTVFAKKFHEYIAVKINSGVALSDLQYVVNRKYFGIVDYLKSTYPELSKHDLDLCCLLCFGFSQYGICYMYNYNEIGSFYNKRSRLRGKLHLAQDYKIEDFIKNILLQLSSRGV